MHRTSAPRVVAAGMWKGGAGRDELVLNTPIGGPEKVPGGASSARVVIVGGTARSFRRGQAVRSVSGKSDPRRPPANPSRRRGQLIGWDATGQRMFSIDSQGHPVRWMMRWERAFGF